MTTPGSGDQPQNPGQGWGQQPPSGPDQPGQTPPAGQQWSAPSDQPQQPGQTQQFGQPGQPQQPYGQPQQPYGQPQQFGQPQQPGQPGQQPWGATGAQPQQPAKKSGLARILPIVAGVVAVIVVGFLVRGFLGGGAPEVGDCVNQSGSDGYEVVDCDSSDAQYRIFGTDDDMTEAEFQADPDTCQAAATASNITDGVSLWYGTSGDTGKVFCAETL